MIAALVAFYVIAAVRSPGIVGLYQDDGIYAGTALSLARGEGYRIAHLPGTPLQAKYPPLFPLLLAPVAMAIGGDPSRLWAFRWPSVICAILSLALLPGLLQRWGFSRRAAVAATVLSGLSPLPFQHAMLALSEAPYLLLTVVLFRWLPGDNEPLGSGRMALLAGTAAAAILCRSIGVALIPALGVFAWRRPADRRVWIPFAAAVAAAVGWGVAGGMMRAHEAARGLGPLYDYYLDYGGWVQTDPSILASVCADNAVAVLRAAGDAVLGWFWMGKEQAPWTIPMYAVGLVAVGGLALLTNRSRVAGAYALSSLAVIVCWPFYPERFLIPLTPLLVASLGLTWQWLSGRWDLPDAAGDVLFLLAAASCLLVDVARFPEPSTLHALNYRFDVAAYERSAEWIRANTAPGDIVVSDHDAWVHLATGRRSLPPARFDPLWIYGKPVRSEVWQEALREHRRLGANWVLATEDWDPPFKSLWFPHIVADRKIFPISHREGDNLILRYQPGAAP